MIFVQLAFDCGQTRGHADTLPYLFKVDEQKHKSGQADQRGQEEFPTLSLQENKLDMSNVETMNIIFWHMCTT